MQKQPKRTDHAQMIAQEKETVAALHIPQPLTQHTMSAQGAEGHGMH